jgi:hypothetical protein
MLRPQQQLIEKWEQVLFAEGVPKIEDPVRLATTAILLENQERAIEEERQSGNDLLQEAVTPTNVSGSAVANWDPILISMVRRTSPNLIAFDVAGVQPMAGPVGLVFAMKSRYVENRTLSTSSPEALYNEARTGFSGDKTVQAGDPSSLPTADYVYDDVSSPEGWTNADDAALNGIGDTFATGHGTTTANAQAMASDVDPSNGAYLNEMGFTIEKTSVTARTRALRAEYSVELAQDLRAIHNLDAETELANILSTEILADMNREVIRTVNMKAKLGAQNAELAAKQNGGIGGVFNLKTDADGRWSVEKFKGMLVQLQRESNVIAKETRLGRGNFAICSSDVAAALSSSGLLDYNPALSTGLNVDDTGNLFAGTINGWLKVFIDPFAQMDYITVGFKGTNAYAAGLFSCPYVPLTPYRAVNSATYQPSIAFKTRYGMIANPFAEDTVAATATDNGLGTNRSNKFFRIMKVVNILVA